MRGKAARALVAGAVGLFLASGAGAAPVIKPGGEPVFIKVSPIPHFRIGHPELTRFGRLDYLGGFEMWSKNRHFGALSGIVSRDFGREIRAVTDNGFWFSATIEEDDEGRPIGIASATLAPMLDGDGKPLTAGDDADAEALTLMDGPDGGRYAVSFEREHRIESYPVKDGFLARSTRMATPKEIRRLRHNRGLESVAAPPPSCANAGKIVAIAERDRDKAADIPGWIIGGPRPGRFRIRRDGDFSITDAAFLPDGGLVLLERLFNFSQGVGMRLRLVPCAALTPGATIAGTVLMTADFSSQIDNMEGLSVHTDARGQTILTLISDDNRSILQRSLLLRFRLREPPLPVAKEIGLRRSEDPRTSAE